MELHTLFCILAVDLGSLYSPKQVARLGFARDTEKIRRNLAAFARNNGLSAFGPQVFICPNGNKIVETEKDRALRLTKDYESKFKWLFTGKIQTRTGRWIDAYSGGVWLEQANQDSIKAAIWLAYSILNSDLEPTAKVSAEYLSQQVVTYSGLPGPPIESSLKRLKDRFGYSKSHDLSLASWLSMIPPSVEKTINQWTRGDSPINAFIPFSPQTNLSSDPNNCSKSSCARDIATPSPPKPSPERKKGTSLVLIPSRIEHRPRLSLKRCSWAILMAVILITIFWTHRDFQKLNPLQNSSPVIFTPAAPIPTGIPSVCISKTIQEEIAETNVAFIGPPSLI